MPKTSDISLNDRLRIEGARRIQNGVFFQLTALTFLVFAYGTDPDQTLFFRYLIGIGFFLVLFRGILYFFFSKKRQNILKIFHIQMGCSVLSALTYGLLSYDAIMHYRTLNSQVVVQMFVITGMMTAVISSLAASPWYQRAYILMAGLPHIIACLEPGLDAVFRNLGIIYSIYIAYLIYCGRAITADLVNAYKAEILSRQQKETLQEVIDLFPGFVALSDSNGAWVTTSQSFEKYKSSSVFQEIFKQFRLGQTTHCTREITWYEHGEEHSYVLSTQKSPDFSMIVVGVPAEEIFEMRKQLDIQRTKAEFSARLATLGEMAGGIAHEVNNPLAVIIGVCSQIAMIAKQPQPDVEKIVNKIDKISKTSFRISKIVTGLQSFSRQSNKDPFVMTELSQLLEDTFELCREKFYQNSILLNVAPIPEVEIPIRSVQISQVLINLLNNAYDAVKKLSNRRVDLKFELTTTDVYIIVSDSGAGIPPSIAERIFDPFFTTKDVGQGTGLGLSISRSILLDHQGDIQLMTDEPQTTFKIHLPLQRGRD